MDLMALFSESCVASKRSAVMSALGTRASTLQIAPAASFTLVPALIVTELCCCIGSLCSRHPPNDTTEDGGAGTGCTGCWVGTTAAEEEEETSNGAAVSEEDGDEAAASGMATEAGGRRLASPAMEELGRSSVLGMVEEGEAETEAVGAETETGAEVEVEARVDWAFSSEMMLLHETAVETDADAASGAEAPLHGEAPGRLGIEAVLSSRTAGGSSGGPRMETMGSSALA